MINRSPSSRKKNIYKPDIAARITFVLLKVQKKYNFNNMLNALGKIETFSNKKIGKFNLVQKIQRRRVYDAFLKILTCPLKNTNKQKIISSSKKLSLSVITQFIANIQKKTLNEFIEKLKNHKPSRRNNEIYRCTKSIVQFINRSKSRSFYLFVENLRKININHIRIHNFSRRMDIFVKKAKQIYLSQAFSQVLKFSFTKSLSKNIQIKQQKVIQQKSSQLKRNQLMRDLRAEIITLKKTLELEQTYKNKSKRQDYEKTLIIQAKGAQNKKISNELQKLTRQNNILTYEINKLQNYVDTQNSSKDEAEGSEFITKLLYEVFTTQKQKQSMNMRQLSALFQKNKIDLNNSLKKFTLSKQNLLVQNIDLKNLITIYQKQVRSQDFRITITASETYKKTFQENQNLREVLEISFLAYMNSRKEIVNNKNELNKIIEGHNSSQKISNVTLGSSPPSSRRIIE